MTNNRKANNSILFLTTLGVYLGLVLVGGPAPQVFAHGALTRNFELQDEIEVHDDLEKKPDNETAGLSISIKTYLEDVELFLSSLRKLGENGKFDPTRDAFEVTQTTLLPCVAANNVGSYTANTFDLKNDLLRPSLERFSKLLTDGYSLADCVPSSRFGGTEVTSSKFTFKLDDGALSVEVSVQKASPEIARRVSEDLRKVFANFTPTAGELARLKIFENTTFKSNNDQVLVITRLPRAGLESLLAVRAE
ncbi:MAG TPA: hypothetical protein VMZ26_08070 [Pyrinomonadaceae bacterium]|nr:hypothetical protein [Pyrinomonadaceae bacterium]